MGNIEIGTILNSEIKKNLDSETPTRMFQVELSEDNDSQDVEELHIPGFQYNPSPKSRGFVARVTNAWKIMLGIDDFIPKETLEPGERLIYSDDAGSIKAKILLKKDGSIEITTLSAVTIIGDIIADGVSLKNHTHAQGNDSDGDTEVETEPPT